MTPKLRKPPAWWYTGTQVQQMWKATGATFEDDCQIRTTFIHLRPVPIAIGWEHALAGVRQLKEGYSKETKVNCTTRSKKSWGALLDHYNAMRWGRPAAGIAMRESSTTYKPHGRHEICWCIDPYRKVWVLDQLLLEPYLVDEGGTFSLVIA